MADRREPVTPVKEPVTPVKEQSIIPVFSLQGFEVKTLKDGRKIVDVLISPGIKERMRACTTGDWEDSKACYEGLGIDGYLGSIEEAIKEIPELSEVGHSWSGNNETALFVIKGDDQSEMETKLRSTSSFKVADIREKVGSVAIGKWVSREVVKQEALTVSKIPADDNVSLKG